MSETDDFARAAADHGIFTESGEWRKTNAAYARVRQKAAVLRSYADQGEDVFEALLAHENTSVRVWAAYYLLPLQPDVAIATLERVATGSGLIASGAATALEEWRAGRLQVI